MKTKYTAMIKRMARSLTAMVLLLSCMLTSASASTVIRREQEQKKWCWATCAQMVGHTITGRLFSQSDICKYVKGGIINDVATIDELASAILLTSRRNPTIYNNEISWLKTLDEVKSDPLTIRIQWDIGGGHFVVISNAGYDAAKGGMIEIVDPAQGTGSKEFGYRELIAGTQILSGYGKWTHTVMI